MSITVIQKPSKFTTSDDAIIFQVESSFANVAYFHVEIYEAATNSVISEDQIRPFPNYQNGSYINISKIVGSTVKWEVNNSQNQFVVPVSRPVLNYKIKLTEYGVVSGALAALSPTLTVPDTFYVWSAELGRYRFNNFNYTKYVINSGLPARFLTFKPNESTVNDLSSEQLYFLHDSEDFLNVVIKTYSTGNSLLNTYSEPVSGLSEKKMFRIQVSPKSLKECLTINFTIVNYYTVEVQDESGHAKTEIRKYFYRPVPCNVKPQNLFFVNSLGGIDCYQMVNVVETNNITRNTIKKNPFKISNGYFTDRNNELLNPTEEIVDITQQGNYTANTQFLTDAETAWLNELFISQQAFVELADASLVPVIITNNSYQVQKQYLNKTGYNTTTVTYQLNGGLIPTESSTYALGFGNGTAQLDFIDNQLNNI